MVNLFRFLDGVGTKEKILGDKFGEVKQIDVMKRGLFDDRIKSMPEKWYADI